MKKTIFVSQGSNDSIGIEIFLKSFSCLTQKQKVLFTLVCSKENLERHLNLLSYHYKINDSVLYFYNNELSLMLLPHNKYIAQNSLDYILNIITKKDLLITLPMNKEELYYKNSLCSGHTEYFRKYFKTNEISMFFKSHKDFLLLLTDHVNLNDVSKKIESQNNAIKIQMTLNYLKSEKIKEVIFSGINPHAGENNTLGTEDQFIHKLVSKLSKLEHKIKFTGPLPADSIFQYRSSQYKQLFVFSYHDQGLNIFKERNRFLGLNITLGMPFGRISVDHGTAPMIVGKNIANYEGSLYTLQESLKVIKTL